MGRRAWKGAGMMKTLLSITLLLTLAGCATAPAPEPVT